MKEWEEQFGPHRGKLVQVDKDQVMPLPLVIAEEQEQIFVITAGPWPNRNSGAVQAKCDMCDDPCGISPKGWAFKQQNSKRPVVCPFCFEVLRIIEAGE